VTTTQVKASSVFDSLQGRWKPVYQEVDGQLVSPAISAATVVEIHDTEFKVLKDGKVSYEGTFTIAVNPDPMPWDIALIYKTSLQPAFLGGPRPGIFQVEGDTLKWCFGQVGQSRPKSLNTYPDSGGVLSIYQRDPLKAAASVGGTPRGFAGAW
jgi:uncharacterized protein (TIGR03067 family)